MPYDIYWEKDGVLVRFGGVLDYNTNTNATNEILDAPQFESLKYIIWDLSDITEQNVTEGEATLIAMQDKLISVRLPKIKMALLAQKQHVQNMCYEYVAKCANYKTDWEFMVSESTEKIRTWVTA